MGFEAVALMLTSLLMGLVLGAVIMWLFVRSKSGVAQNLPQQEQLQTTQQLLDPLAQALRRFQDRLTTVEKERTWMSAQLETKLEQVAQTSADLRKETQNLSHALRKPQARGAWGEHQLRNLVEAAGMLPHCDFLEQYSATSSDGGLQRPDMKVNLGSGRVIFVDSKVPLSAFLDSLDAPNDVIRKELERSFASQVKAHIHKLGGKHYWDLASGPNPEQVILFLPSEGFLLAALEMEPGLYQYGLEHGVLLATPNTLLAMLHTIAHSWQQTELAQNAQNVLQEAAGLYVRLLTLHEHVNKVGKALSGSVDAYNKFVGSWESRVLPKARQLQILKGDTHTLQAHDQLSGQIRQLSE